MDLFEFQGKQFFARFGIPVSAGRRRPAPSTTRWPSPSGSATRWWSRPRCRWAGGARRAASSWPTTPTRPAPTPATSSAWTSRATSSKSCGSSTPPTSPRSTTPASRSTARPRSTSACCRPRAASRSKRSPRRTPTPSPRSAIDPVDGLTEAAARAGSTAAKLNPEATDGAVDILLKLYRGYIEGDADLVEINPLILTPDGEVHALDAKVTSTTTPRSATPSTRPYDATQVRDDARDRWPRRRACSTSASTAPSASSPTAPASP